MSIKSRTVTKNPNGTYTEQVRYPDGSGSKTTYRHGGLSLSGKKILSQTRYPRKK